MGVVAEAEHELLGQRVAIKLLRSDRESWNAVARFMREARASARLRSEHVARTYDCGILEDGLPFLVLELLDGHDLKVVLRSRGPVPTSEAVDYALEAIAGLAEAHLAGIIHRDLKLSNLFLARRADGRDVIKVLDFGVSKLIETEADSGERDLTGTDTLLGSPRYMAPEQASTPGDVDARSDIWSVGVILYELVTGVRPIEGANLTEVLTNLLTGDIVPAHTHRSDIPLGLSETMQRCLQRDRTRRFRDVRDLADALEPFATERGRAAATSTRQLFEARAQAQPAAGGAVVTTDGAEAITRHLEGRPPGGIAGAAAEPISSDTATPRPIERHRRRWWWASAVPVAVAAGAAWFLFRSSPIAHVVDLVPPMALGVRADPTSPGPSAAAEDTRPRPTRASPGPPSEPTTATVTPPAAATSVRSVRAPTKPARSAAPPAPPATPSPVEADEDALLEDRE